MANRPQFAADEIYHVYNRGVEKRLIFNDDSDRIRFVDDLYEFNDTAPAQKRSPEVGLPTRKDIAPAKNKYSEVRLPIQKVNRDTLVDILCFCLMPNHYHLLIRAKSESAVTEFMRKLGTGFTNYFNKKYERSGVLFQGKFKAVHIASDSQLMYIPHYIHLNPLDICMPEWKTIGVSSHKKALGCLEQYEWSSFHDYMGNQKFSFLLETSFIDSMFKTKRGGYGDELKRWIKDMNLDAVKDVTID